MSYLKIPVFEFDSTLNKSIEKQMLEKGEERKAFKTEKEIKSRKFIDQEN